MQSKRYSEKSLWEKIRFLKNPSTLKKKNLKMKTYANYSYFIKLFFFHIYAIHLECAILLSVCSLVGNVNVLYKWKKVMEFIKEVQSCYLWAAKQRSDPSNSFSPKWK